MQILEYIDLNTSKVKTAYKKVIEAIKRDDFRSADVKKLSNLTHGRFYRAKLDYANRLLFSIVKVNEQVFALMLEVIENHDYDSSRFLRGASIDDNKIPDIDVAEAIREAQPLRYLHPSNHAIHLLDKPISFDDAQTTVYRQPPPLIVVGSAGSGKTALTLEKFKQTEGEVLYVTHSAFLAQSARDIYYANGFEHEKQDASFLSFREFIESIHVPTGREALWRDFAGWFTRQKQQYKDVDGHQAFEEIRGVLAANAETVLSRQQYLQLGVRQSIFPESQRDKLYDLFEKYQDWLKENKLYDLNLVAHEWKARAQPRYDFIVIDEVQDMTPVQLSLVLKTLKKPENFLICGDSNQIVHPNFFSWAQIKSLFWRDEKLAERQSLSVLTANYRNGQEATRVANTLLKIKHQRFGSIDRESNFLVQAVGGEPGEVSIFADKDAVKRELDQKIRQSTQIAVLVMRDEDKAEARKHFNTPLLFSIHEAKGLEYENIVLYRFVSDYRQEFSDISEGVTLADLQSDELAYRRAKDKNDKSLEVYKFFVNALYVALTRAIKNIYLIESDLKHPLFSLLNLTIPEKMKVEVKTATLEDWQKEARKLELQGKQEQADAIRSNILKQVPPPWPVFDETALRNNLVKVFSEDVPGKKLRQQLFEYATCYDEAFLSDALRVYGKYPEAVGHNKLLTTLGRKHYVSYYAKNTKDILKQCDMYGVEHRTPMNLTPLMAASVAGNIPLVEALLERGANLQTTDHLGQNALHWAMREAARDHKFAKESFPTLYELIAPSHIDVQAGQRFIRIDKHISEYFLLQMMWTLFRSRFTHAHRKDAGTFDNPTLQDMLAGMPRHVMHQSKDMKSYVSSLLSRNEVDRDYAYNRALFKRIRIGHYQFNPELLIRVGEEWQSVFQVLNLPLIHHLSYPQTHAMIDKLLQSANLATVTTPIIRVR